MSRILPNNSTPEEEAEWDEILKGFPEDEGPKASSNFAWHHPSLEERAEWDACEPEFQHLLRERPLPYED